MLMAWKVDTRQVLEVDEGMCSFISLVLFLASFLMFLGTTTTPLQNLVRLVAFHSNLQMREPTRTTCQIKSQLVPLIRLVELLLQIISLGKQTIIHKHGLTGKLQRTSN